MAWIKRNLFFVIGSVVALGLMVFGIIVLLGQISAEQAVSEKIQTQYATLKTLSEEKPHPGDGTVDNIKATREQEAQLRGYTASVRKMFQAIPPIPDNGTNRISDSEFATQLRYTMTQLHRSAEQQSVLLTIPDYYFSFEAQKKIMNFDPASLNAMAQHLGEIKVLCDVLFAAKINSLDLIKREVVSLNDNVASDYLTDQKTVSTPLADLTPYEVSFHCFSTELAQVLSGLASSQYGFVVKAINEESTASTGLGDEVPPAMQTMQVMPTQPYAEGRRPRGAYAQQPVMTQAAPVTRASTTFLNEKPVRVTLLVQVVKIKPAAK